MTDTLNLTSSDGQKITIERKAAEADDRGDYSPMWAGQAAALGRAVNNQPPEGAQALTERLARELFELLGETP